jgi:hypothetical protein
MPALTTHDRDQATHRRTCPSKTNGFLLVTRKGTSFLSLDPPNSPLLQGLTKFYSALYAAFLRHIPVESLRVIVIASPGFTKDSVYDYIFQEATRTSNKPVLQARHKFVRVHVSSPHVHSLVDVLKSPEVSEIIFSSMG